MRKKRSLEPALTPIKPETRNTSQNGSRLSFSPSAQPNTPASVSSSSTTLSPLIAQGNWTQSTGKIRRGKSPLPSAVSFNNIITACAAKPELPFGEEYRLLNKIAFYNQEKKTPELAECLYSFVTLEKITSSVGKNLYQEIKKFFENTIKNDTLEDALRWDEGKDIFIATMEKFSVEKNLFHSFFPAQYITHLQTSSMAEERFPSSLENRVGNRFSHFLKNTNGKGGIIATDIPHQGDDITAMNCFLKMLWDYNVREICFIGFSPNRQLYQKTKANPFETKDDPNHTFTLSHHEKDSMLNKVIIRKGFSAQDQHSLVLNEEDLKTLIDLHELSKTKVVAIHCDSGVGRTGQLILLLKLLDLCQNNRDFKNSFDALLNDIIEEKTLSDDVLTENIDIFFKHAGNSLSQLRKTRYFVEQEKQFSDVLPLMMKVVAYQRKIAPLKREKIDALLQNVKGVNLESPNTFGSMVATPPSSSGSGKLFPLSPMARFSPRPPGGDSPRQGSAGRASGFFKGLRHCLSVGSTASDSTEKLEPKDSIDSLATPATPSSPC